MRGEGSCVGVGGDSAVQSHSVGGVRGRAEGHTHTHTHTGSGGERRDTHTHTQALTGTQVFGGPYAIFSVEIP